eukprot:1267706-Pleurochrysis_carterae.AAC.2
MAPFAETKSNVEATSISCCGDKTTLPRALVAVSICGSSPSRVRRRRAAANERGAVAPSQATR